MNICGFNVGINQPFFLIAGPCVIEREALAIDTAGTLKEITERLQIPFIYIRTYVSYKFLFYIRT